MGSDLFGFSLLVKSDPLRLLLKTTVIIIEPTILSALISNQIPRQPIKLKLGAEKANVRPIPIGTKQDQIANASGRSLAFELAATNIGKLTIPSINPVPSANLLNINTVKSLVRVTKADERPLISRLLAATPQRGYL